VRYGLAKELELVLRDQAGKFRVVQTLSGGAHVLFPGVETTIAVRAYYPSQLNEKLSDKNHDGLEAFRDAFKHPVVFFILPSKVMQEQLNQRDSFVNAAQNIVCDKAKVFFVSETKSVVDTILVLLDALHPERRKLREKYYHHIRATHYLERTADQQHVSSHIRNETRELAHRLGFAAGEAEILMNTFGSLRNICNADHDALKDLPLESDTKRKLLTFFASNIDPNGRTPLPQDTNNHMHGNEFEVNDPGEQFDDMLDYNQFQSGDSYHHDGIIFAPTRPPPLMHHPSFSRHDPQPPPFSTHGGHHAYQSPPFSSHGRPPFDGGHQLHQQDMIIQPSQHHHMQYSQQQYRPSSHWAQALPTDHPYSEYYSHAPQQPYQYAPPQPHQHAPTPPYGPPMHYVPPQQRNRQPPGTTRKFARGMSHRTPAGAMSRFL